MGFLRDLYDFRQARYSTVETLADDVMRLARARLEGTIKHLEL